MKVIHMADKSVAGVWCGGEIQKDNYRLFTYLVSAEANGGKLLLNTVSGELIYIDSEETAKLSQLPCAYDGWMDELIRKRFLVRCEADDEKTVNTLRKVYRLANQTGDITDYTVLPTTNCNAHCFYCYEAGCEHETMSNVTAEKVVSFIAEHHGNSRVRIRWFGGEPLVGMRQIDRICKALKEKCIAFSSSMISNGYLFDEALAGRVKEDWNLAKIQITLDGTEQVYNNTKSYVNPCDSPYRRVLNNIGLLLQNGIRVGIRLNLGMHNSEDLSVLVRELAEQFKDKKNLAVYSHLLFDDCGFIPTGFNEKEYELLEEKKRELDGMIAVSGLAPSGSPLTRLKISCCMADNDSSLVILPDGRLGKCEHFISEHLIGTLETGLENTEEMRLFKETEQCDFYHDCPLYPGCIKLKLCQPERTCTLLQQKSKLNALVQNMIAHYEDFLHDNKKTAGLEDLPVCQKGEPQ